MSLALWNDWLILATTEGQIAIAKPNAEGPGEMRSYSLDRSGAWAHPAWRDGHVLIKSASTLACYRFAKRETKKGGQK